MTRLPENFDLDTVLTHYTPRANIDRIWEEGLEPMSYWAVGDVSDAYRADMAEEGERPTGIRITLRDLLDLGEPEPDYPGIEEPFSYTLGKSEEEIWEDWSETEKDWASSLDLINSLRVPFAIPAEKLTFDLTPGPSM